VEKWFETFKAPLFDLNGSVTGTAGFARDITERKQLEEKLQQRTQTLSALQATLFDVASPRPLPELLNLVVERAASLLDSTSGGLYLCDPERQEVKCVVSHQTLRDYTGVVLRYGEGAAGTVAQSGQPLIIDDYRLWPGRARVFDADEPFSSVLSMPMWWHGQITGVIHVLRSDERRPFTIGDVELLGLFADHAAIAVEQARLTASLEQELIERERADAALRELNVALEERVAERTRELLDANLRLTELDRLKDEFISRISHELRTPLTNIKIYLNLLEQGKLEKREQYLLTLNEQADKLQRLIDDLLDVAYLNVDALEAHRVQLDVNALAHELVTDRTAQAHERELTLTLAQEADLPRVTTDRALLRQVLVNVVANALSYTPRGGSVTLRTAQQTRAGSAWVTIEVRDSGPGIAEQDLPHIFQPFYRGAVANDYKTPGTGVGLTIARRILEQLGGRIAVESQPGQGATFTIWLRAK
jgi:signal transduction histidine kinase